MGLNDNSHFEILGRKGSSWTVVEIKHVRSEVEEAAEALWKSRRYSAVKVIKESFNPKDKTFSSVEIFNRGKARKVSKYDQSKTITPCLTPDNLYSAAGRASIWDLLHNMLYEWRITPTELLHSYNHYNKLYNAGTRLQNAIQRTAVAYEESDESIQERMRKLYKVIDQAVEIIKDNQDRVPILELGRLKPIIAQLDKVPNKAYLLTACLTKYIEPAVTLEDKLGRLAVFLAPGRPDWVMAVFDQLIAELLLHRGLLRQVLSTCESRGAILVTLAHWSAGLLDRASSMLNVRFSEDLLLISKYVFNGHLPETGQILNNQLKNELASSDKLVEGGSLLEQFEVLHQLNRALTYLAETQARFVGMDENISARQARLINSQAIAEFMTPFQDPVEKANALLDLERVTIGNSTVRDLANFLLPMLSTPENETLIMRSKNNLLKSMQAVSAIQKRVLKSKFNEMHKRKISEKLDDFCKNIMRKSDMLKKLDSVEGTVRDKTLRLLNMLLSDTFTEGVARASVSHMVQHYMQDPTFPTQYVEGFPEEKHDELWKELSDLVQKAGINNVSDLSFLVLQDVEQDFEEPIEDVIKKSDLYGKKASEDLW